MSLVWRVDRAFRTVYLVAVCTCDREDDYVQKAKMLYPDDAVRVERAPLNHLFGERDLLSVMNKRWHSS